MDVSHTPDPSLRSRFYRLKRVTARILCHRWVGQAISLSYRNQIPSHGAIIDTSLSSLRPETKASLWWGIYESAEARFVNEYLRRDLDVVELGSSLGLLSSLIARKLDRSRKLVCLEANSALLQSIKNNVERNGPGLRVEVLHAAISYTNDNGSSVGLALARDNTDSHLADEKSAGSSIPVPACTLGRLLSEHQIGDYTLVSDIEGAEVGFIEMDGGSLEGCKQMIIELHETKWSGRNVSVARMKQRLMEDYGFHLRAQRGPVCVFNKQAPAGP